jgi:hypothetical protein
MCVWIDNCIGVGVGMAACSIGRARGMLAGNHHTVM